MTLAELTRRVKSYERVTKMKLQQQASLDWQLGNLIGISVARCMDNSVKYPSVYEAYDDLFDAKEIEAAKQKATTQSSVANFMAYAAAHNIKFKKQGGEVNG